MKLKTNFYKNNKICWVFYTLLVMLDGVMNLILSVILVHWFGIYGVLIATVAALPLKVVYCAYISDKKIMKRSCKKTVTILGANYLFFAAVVAAEKYIHLNIENYLDFVAACVVTTMICGICGVAVNIAANPDCVGIVKIFLNRKK